MNKGLYFVGGIVAGAAIGSLITWRYLKEKYERIAQEEIDSVKEVFSKREQDLDKKHKDDLNEQKKELERKNYENVTTVLGYSNVESEPVMDDGPKVISPEEFGEYEEYELTTLFYFNDGYLTDADHNLIEDVESMVGYESLDHFGDYEDCAVHVRNDQRQCDYEILLDYRNYEDVLKDKRLEAEPYEAD